MSLGDDAPKDQGVIGKFDAQRGGVVGEAALLLGGHAESPDDAPEEIMQSRRKSFSILARKKNPNVVLPEDLTSIRNYLKNELSEFRVDLLAKINHVTSTFESELQEMRDKIFHDAAEFESTRRKDRIELERFTKDCAARLSQDMNMVRYTLEQRMHTAFEANRMNLRDMQHKESLALHQLDRALQMTKAQLSAVTAVRWSSTVALMAEQRRAVDESIDSLRSEMLQQNESARRKAADDLAEYATVQRKRDAAQDACLIENHNDLKHIIGETDQKLSDHSDASASEVNSFKSAIHKQVADIRTDADQRIKVVEAEARRLFTVVSEVENIPTRRVEWIVKDASIKLLRACGETAWLSPKFEAAGAHSLQLELKLLSGSEASEAEGSYGDCGVYLWASDGGLRLVCKLFVGCVCAQIQHTFDGSNTPCGAKRFGCILREQIAKETDTLKVGIEILEAVREVQNLPRPPSASSTTRSRAGEFLDGPVMSHRYLNHRTLELVQDQVDLMRSRMVRRIEWRLQQASALPRCFPESESLCSTTFEAAGVGGMQLVFYPSGYSGAKDGYCSFFLHCPSGSALRCWLHAGKQRREAKLAFEQAGFFGRTNFCRYENTIDPADDSVLLVLEIDEAQHDMEETMWHQPLAQPTQLQAQDQRALPQDAKFGAASYPGSRVGEGSPKDGAIAEQVDLVPEKIDSSVKLRRAPGRIALEDVRQLPSIWTSRPVGNITEALDGFYNFADVHRIKRPPASARGNRPTPFVDRVAEVTSPKRQQEVAPRYMMYAT